MNIGTTIALIYFVIILYYVVAFTCYYVAAFYPSWVWKDACPEFYLDVLRMINFVLDWIFSRLFIVLTTVLLLLFAIWLILKSQPWPLNNLRKIPPLGDLEKAGIFGLFERLTKVIFSMSYPRKKIRQFVDAIGIFLKDFILEWSKDKNPRLHEFISNNSPDKEMYPVKMSSTKSNDKRKPHADENKEQMINRMEKIVDEMEKTCIAQNSKSITSDMNMFTAQSIRLQNQNAEIQCKIKSLPEYLKINMSNV